MGKFREHCKFNKKGISAFKHVDLLIDESEKGQCEIKALEEEIKNLKHETARLKKDARIKENKLAAYIVNECEDAKLFKEITGDLTDKEQNEEISQSESYLCEKCDSAFDEEMHWKRIMIYIIQMEIISVGNVMQILMQRMI